ncbi:hypothetical protein BGX30_003889 [Mortierella sp. GBA39]|nr:hypothetical protein BGX30_003889 [Mortierella sp. GBA39]
MSTLDNCTRLEELRVHRFNMDDIEASELGRFLRPVPATLKTLLLVGLEGGRFDLTTIWFPQVTNLTLNVSDGSETRTFLGLQELLTRCPNLERLTFSPLNRSTKLDRVATIIKNHCPKLTFSIPLTLSSDTEICKVVWWWVAEDIYGEDQMGKEVANPDYRLLRPCVTLAPPWNYEGCKGDMCPLRYKRL